MDFEAAFSFYTRTLVKLAMFFRRDLALQVGEYDEDIVFYEEATLPQNEKLETRIQRKSKNNIVHPAPRRRLLATKMAEEKILLR